MRTNPGGYLSPSEVVGRDDLIQRLWRILERQSLVLSADRPLLFDDLFNRLKARLPTEDDERAREVLTLLRRDHYVLQQTDGCFCFRSPLIQRYWRLCRGLGQ